MTRCEAGPGRSPTSIDGTAASHTNRATIISVRASRLEQDRVPFAEMNWPVRRERPLSR